MGTKVVQSPKKGIQVRSVWFQDDSGGEAYIHCAILQRGEALPWSFTGRGRAFVFSWSPDAHYLLVGLVKPGKDMSLYWVDATAKHPKEHDLGLEKVAERVYAALPERDSGSLASHDQVDFERVEWLSRHKCRLHHISQFDRKSGEAILTLDLAAAKPALKVENIIPKGPE